ncbi:MAG: VOC family protein [Bacteroidota bacterium]
MGRIVHFELSSENPEVAAEFYGKAFGWAVMQFGEGSKWIATTGDDHKPGINGAIIQGDKSVRGVTNIIEVDSIDKAIFRVESYGGKIVSPKTIIPNVGWIAYFEDPDGNVMGIMQTN